nr:MAG TPA: hypothetical protein [Crassvirales sp.]
MYKIISIISFTIWAIRVINNPYSLTREHVYAHIRIRSYTHTRAYRAWLDCYI